MKRIPLILLTCAALCALVTVVQHAHSRRARTALERERLEILASTQRAQAEHAETGRQLEAARSRVSAAALKTKAATAPSLAAAADGRNLSATPVKPTAGLATPDPEMRRVRVQTFAGEQRMQFAALLHRLGFTPAQRQAFDRINENYYEAMLDERLDAAGRDAARASRAEALHALFGAHHDTWREANQQAMARGIVDGIIQQTFPSSGALNAAQADELTRIVSQHRLPSGSSSPTSFDWDAIIRDARTILADRQMDDFVASVSHRRATEQMSAIAKNSQR